MCAPDGGGDCGTGVVADAGISPDDPLAAAAADTDACAARSCGCGGGGLGPVVGLA